MSIKKIGEDKWLLDIKPGGRQGTRIRKIFEKQAEAKAYQTYALTKHRENEEWRPAFRRSDVRTLEEVACQWHDLHGHTLRSGEGTKQRLIAISRSLKNIVAADMTPEKFAEYRKKRNEEGISPTTTNRELTLLKAMFQKLIEMGKWKLGNPLSSIKKQREPKQEMNWLNDNQVESVLQATSQSINPHIPLAIRFALATGARYKEIELLKITQVRDGIVQIIGYKDNEVRPIPVTEEMQRHLEEHHRQHGTGDQIFGVCKTAGRGVLKRAGIQLKGQAWHVFRHTFASHFVQKGGDILTLQKVLGHSDLKMTMIYAHLAPNHLEQVLELNPLSPRKPKLSVEQLTTQTECVRRLSIVVHEMVKNSTAEQANGFDEEAWLLKWVEIPQPALGGAKPSELLHTEAGLKAVIYLLRSAETGTYL